ncbi:tat pathway signal sequence domain protein [Anopheles sinensis]|uniref:Tat pathway signal sequence domain protein n=1 Tax=Anopheles sinensis TaxID=74873 RepID=A0A084VQK7_ANOSI|nr:tat pathway signal sequence domain protein [Anopheles sinensis]
MFTQTNRDIRFSSVANGDDNDDTAAATAVSAATAEPVVWVVRVAPGVIASRGRKPGVCELDASDARRVTNASGWVQSAAEPCDGMCGRLVGAPSLADLYRKKKKPVGCCSCDNCVQLVCAVGLRSGGAR